MMVHGSGNDSTYKFKPHSNWDLRDLQNCMSEARGIWPLKWVQYRTIFSRQICTAAVLLSKSSVNLGNSRSFFLSIADQLIDNDPNRRPSMKEVLASLVVPYQTFAE